MSNDFDEELRAALRPVDPGSEFSSRVLARLASSDSQPKQPSGAHSRLRQPALRWLPAALAASIVLAVAARYEWQERHEQRGREARRQLIEALQVTSEKLDLAYRVVNARTQSEADENAGA